MEAKPTLYGLVRDNPKTPEGKYLVLRRDDTVPEWPWFVLGAKDPISPWALRMYAVVGFLMYWNWKWSRAVWKLAAEFRQYRRLHGTGDPDKGIHRKDCPEVIARMREGHSA
jgi:hypothetical protein